MKDTLSILAAVGALIAAMTVAFILGELRGGMLADRETDKQLIIRDLKRFHPQTGKLEWVEKEGE